MEEQLVRLVPIMFAAVIAMIGWVGKRLHDKMDAIGDQLSAHRNESERRITKVETSIGHMEHRLEMIEAKMTQR